MSTIILNVVCSNCKYVYIGKTCPSFNLKIKEQLHGVRLETPDSSNVSKHLLNNNKSCSVDNLKVLHVENRELKYKILKAVRSP